MKPGDRFSTKGYDVVATTTVDDGTVLVLNNNGTHYIVAFSLDWGNAVYLASYAYDQNTVWAAYKDALKYMVHVTLSRSFSLKDV